MISVMTTGTRAFMAIGVLHEKHSFMDDLESFFRVLFWICIHYNELEPAFLDVSDNAIGICRKSKRHVMAVEPEKGFYEDRFGRYCSYIQKPL